MNLKQQAHDLLTDDVLASAYGPMYELASIDARAIILSALSPILKEAGACEWVWKRSKSGYFMGYKTACGQFAQTDDGRPCWCGRKVHTSAGIDV